MSSIRLELLDKERSQTLEKLKIFSKMAVLGGGTALSLQIAHRFSFDFGRKSNFSEFLGVIKART